MYLFSDLGLDILHDELLVALKHSAVTFFIFCDFHDFLLVGGHEGSRDVYLHLTLKEVKLHGHECCSDVVYYLFWLVFIC